MVVAVVAFFLSFAFLRLGLVWLVWFITKRRRCGMVAGFDGINSAYTRPDDKREERLACLLGLLWVPHFFLCFCYVFGLSLTCFAG